VRRSPTTVSGPSPGDPLRAVGPNRVQEEAPRLCDPGIPFLARALEPGHAQAAFHALFEARGEVPLALNTIRVHRHKPGRRCLVGYTFASDGTDARDVTVLAKVRAKGVDTRAYALQRALWQTGFGLDSADGVRVPEPLGVLPELGAWSQRQVPGSLTVERLAGRDGAALGARCADTIHKLHRSAVAVDREHGAQDELAILTARLRLLAERRPEWAERLERMLMACHEVASCFVPSISCPIHRDFYQDQLLVDGHDVHLLDLDLCARGDPGLDVGNFVAHLLELSLRTYGDFTALDCARAAFEARYLELAGEAFGPSIDVHTTWSLARLVQLSTVFVERRALTERLMTLVEARLALA
jgi:hypothetical protein